MTSRRRASIALLTVFTIVGAAASCLDFGDLSGGVSNDAGGETGTSDALEATTSVDGGSDARPEPTIKLAAGGFTTCAVQKGIMKCWGDNYYGQLGLGSADGAEHATPEQLVGLSFTPTMMAIAGEHTCASDGTHSSCWGYDQDTQLGRPPSADAGCILATANCPIPLPVDLGPVASLSLGNHFSCFISTGGQVSCFGTNGSGQLGPLSIGGDITAPQAIDGLSNGANIIAGLQMVCARASDESVWCWGDNQYGELGQKTSDAGAGVDNLPHPTPLKVPGISARQISCGWADVCATLDDNTVTCWGWNNAPSGPGDTPAGQLGHDPLTDPAYLGTGSVCDPTPTPVVALKNVREVSAGTFATCAVRTDDSVVCWGDNVTGLLNQALNIGSSADPYNYTPQVMPGLANVAHIAMGYQHACAVTWDDHVFCWGDNSRGQLGVPLVDGGPTFSGSPVTPQGF